MDIQSQIDDLFSPTPDVVEEPQEEIVEEQVKKPEYERVTLSDDLFGDINENDITELTEALTEVQEAIDIKKADMGEVIKDFRQSDAPQFKGKSKKKKQQMAIAAKLNTESYEERLMNTVMSQITKNAKNDNTLKEVGSLNEEERFRNIETQLIQVRQLFHEATMVSGIGQGGDGQTPGSGEVKLARLDDVSMDNIHDGDSLIWDSATGGFVPGAGGGGGGVTGVDRIIAGTGIDVDPVGGIGNVEISADLALEELRNVDGSPSNGDLLIYDGANWGVGKLTDTEIAISNPGPNNGDALTQEAANTYFGSTLDDHDGRIDALENATVPGTFLGAIDVTDPNNEPADTNTLNKGDYYIHEGPNGNLWGSTEPDAETVENGNQVIWDGTNWVVVSTVSTLAQLGDTDVDSAITGDLLVYDDGTDTWVSQTVPIPTVTVGAVQPNTGDEKDGDFWYDNVNDILYIYDSVWTVAGSSGGARVAIGAVPPVTPAPEEGDLWVSNDDWALYTFDGFNWVALTNNGLVGGDSGTGYVTDDQLSATVDTLTFNTTEVQNNLNVAVLALDQTHLRITPQAQLLGPLLLSDDTITVDKQATTKEYVDTLVSTTAADYLPLSGGQITGTLTFMRGNKTNDQFKISPNSSETDFSTNVYSLNGGQMRLRTSHTNDEGDHVGSHIVMDPKDGTPETKIYHVVTPTSGQMAANKQYVDDEIAALPTPAGVPVGCIMVWMNSTAPDGWFKLQGGSFDINAYPLLHDYLSNTGAYTTGQLPNWGGYFPGEWGESNGTGSLGTKQGYRTAEPSGGAPKSSASIPNGATRGFSPAGSTNAYSAGASQVTINNGWDSVTRPNTILVHYIIKHD